MTTEIQVRRILSISNRGDFGEKQIFSLLEKCQAIQRNNEIAIDRDDTNSVINVESTVAEMTVLMPEILRVKGFINSIQQQVAIDFAETNDWTRVG